MDSNDRSLTYAKATGRFVRKPKAIDEIPEMAAVAVMRSLLIPSNISSFIESPICQSYLIDKHCNQDRLYIGDHHSGSHRHKCPRFE